MTAESVFLQSAIKRMVNYKSLGDRALEQLSEDDFYNSPNETSNSIAIIIQHMAGNMLSRWTDFLTTDGEKPWRKRDIEFNNRGLNYQQLLNLWETGWQCFINTLESLTPQDLLKTIYIRTEPLTVIDAINRQLTHYPYHVGQIIYIAKAIKNTSWQTLSIAKDKSDAFNNQMKTSG